MDIETLREIVRSANLRAIKKALRAADFRACKYDRTLRHASLYDIATAPYEKTPFFSDGKGNEFVGDLCRGVKGFEDHEFIIVQQLSPFKRGREDLSTKKLLVYAKKRPMSAF